jgi:hypothetical protein
MFILDDMIKTFLNRVRDCELNLSGSVSDSWEHGNTTMNRKFTTAEQMINLTQANINLSKTLFYGSVHPFFTCLY